MVSGEVDIAIQSNPELTSIEGVEIVGPLPGDLGSTTVFAAGVGASSPNSETGKALVKFLASPEAQRRSRRTASIRPDSQTTIITGFSISVLNAPISSAPSAPSTER